MKIINVFNMQNKLIHSEMLPEVKSSQGEILDILVKHDLIDIDIDMVAESMAREIVDKFNENIEDSIEQTLTDAIEECDADTSGLYSPMDFVHNEPQIDIQLLTSWLVDNHKIAATLEPSGLNQHVDAQTIVAYDTQVGYVVITQVEKI